MMKKYSKLITTIILVLVFLLPVWFLDSYYNQRVSSFEHELTAIQNATGSFKEIHPEDVMETLSSNPDNSYVFVLDKKCSECQHLVKNLYFLVNEGQLYSVSNEIYFVERTQYSVKDFPKEVRGMYKQTPVAYKLQKGKLVAVWKPQSEPYDRVLLKILGLGDQL